MITFCAEGVRMHFRRGRFSLLLFSLIATSLFSQDPVPASTPDRPTFKSKVRAVLVDVVVTSGKGEPIPDLHKEDFEVLEEGKPQTVSFFEEHKGAPPTQTKLPPMQPNVFTNFPTT